MAAILKDTGAKFAVTYDQTTDTIKVTLGQNHDEDVVVLGENKERPDGEAFENYQKIFYAEGNTIELNGYTINDNNYFRLRDLGKAFKFGVSYDYNTDTVLIDSENPDLKDIEDENYYTAPIVEIETKAGVEKVRFLIYGFDQCPYCQKLKAYLDENRIPYLFRNIKENDEKIKEVYESFYKNLDEDYDRVYYPTTILTLEKDGKSIDKAVVGFTQEMYDEIFNKIKDNTYFIENK